MFKKIPFVLLICFFGGCNDDKTVVPSECVKVAFELFKDDLSCSSQGIMEVNLYQGIYKDEVIYFVNITCAFCDVTYPSWGYSCQNERVEIDDFLELKDIIRVYDSCTRKFL